MSDDVTTRFALPLLRTGQAQKEVTHNEAVALLDILVQASVEAVGVAAPPVAPLAGQCWIVGAAPTGEWAGRAGHLAGWTGGGWRFIAPREGQSVWSNADQTAAVYTAGGWSTGVVRCARIEIAGTPVLGSRRAAIADPGGGTVVDAEARQAVADILAALRGHGLISS